MHCSVTCNCIRTGDARRQLENILRPLKYTKCKVNTNYFEWNSRIQKTFIFLNLQFNYLVSRSKFPLEVAGWGVSYITSFTGYKKMIALFLQPWTFDVHILTVSHNSLSKMVICSLSAVGYWQNYSVQQN